MTTAIVPCVSGGQEEHGHLEEFRTDPIALISVFSVWHTRRSFCCRVRKSSKVIFSVLLRECEFEMAQPADTYRNDHSKRVVQLERPAKVCYRKRVRL